MADAVRYVISRSLVDGISADRIWDTGAHPTEKPKPNTHSIATIPVRIAAVSVTTPKLAMVYKDASWMKDPSNNSGL